MIRRSRACASAGHASNTHTNFDMDQHMKYGPRDAASILMYHRHRVALRFNGAKRWWTLDGKRVSLAELEDAAERYERIKDRTTPRP